MQQIQTSNNHHHNGRVINLNLDQSSQNTIINTQQLIQLHQFIGHLKQLIDAQVKDKEFTTQQFQRQLNLKDQLVNQLQLELIKCKQIIEKQQLSIHNPSLNQCNRPHVKNEQEQNQLELLNFQSDTTIYYQKHKTQQKSLCQQQDFMIDFSILQSQKNKMRQLNLSTEHSVMNTKRDKYIQENLGNKNQLIQQVKRQDYKNLDISQHGIEKTQKTQKLQDQQLFQKIISETASVKTVQAKYRSPLRDKQNVQETQFQQLILNEMDPQIQCDRGQILLQNSSQIDQLQEVKENVKENNQDYYNPQKKKLSLTPNRITNTNSYQQNQPNQKIHLSERKIMSVLDSILPSSKQQQNNPKLIEILNYPSNYLQGQEGINYYNSQKTNSVYDDQVLVGKQNNETNHKQLERQQRGNQIFDQALMEQNYLTKVFTPRENENKIQFDAQAQMGEISNKAILGIQQPRYKIQDINTNNLQDFQFETMNSTKSLKTNQILFQEHYQIENNKMQDFFAINKENLQLKKQELIHNLLKSNLSPKLMTKVQNSDKIQGLRLFEDFMIVSSHPQELLAKIKKNRSKKEQKTFNASSPIINHYQFRY